MIARGQIEWALLLALKNGIEKNSISVDPEDVRSVCIAKGFYDKKNFATNFKKEGNAKYFSGPMVPQGASQQLSTDGQTELGKLLETLSRWQRSNKYSKT